jgi:L-ascorbate metabolism protein UlaG (beta-lactamase superfamily)
MYISGDTLIHDDLHEIPRRYKNIDLALLHLGGTRVLGILVTMDASQGVECLRIIQPDMAIPIHYNDYDVFKDPLENFIRAVERAGLQNKVRYLDHGESYAFAPRVNGAVELPASMDAQPLV